MNAKTLKLGHGNWVDGDRFWDREAEIALFTRWVEEGAHILLVAQRRMGKTSLMREAARLLADRYACVFVDLQKARNAPEAVVELSLALQGHKTLWEKTKELFANILERVATAVGKIEAGELGVVLRAGLTAGDWAEKGDRLFGILAESDKPVLLLIDEVPILVNRILRGGNHAITPQGRAEADQFMSWLRQNTIRHKGKVSLVVSGSIGFEPILHQAGLSATINTLEPFELRAWDDRTAIGCLQALANEYGVEFLEGAATAMIRKLGCCIPHHVEMFFSYVYDMCKRRGSMTFSPDEVEGVYDREMLGIRGHAELTTYEERLANVLAKEALPLALEILTEAAVGECLTPAALRRLEESYAFEGEPAGDAGREILGVLEHDGYLVPGPKGYVFVSKLVRDWWRKRYGGLYVPVLQRGN